MGDFQQKGPGGRPSEYDPEYCERVIELGRKGDTIVDIAADLDVAKQTLYNWMDEHPEFLDAIDRARGLAEAWWSKQGKKGIWSRDFNASAYRLQMMNRFGWGEKSQHEHSGPGGGPIEMDVDDARDRLAQTLEEMSGRQKDGDDDN